MLTSDIKNIDFGGKNFVKSHIVNLDKELDCVILLSVKDQKLKDLLYNKILDALIDRVHPKNVYKDFSSALENINAFLSNWKVDNEKVRWLHAIIGIYHGKSFLFSTVWKASCLLYNSHGDVIEVTDKADDPKDFSFISSGDIAYGEVLIVSTLRILDILSKDDIKDGLEFGDIERSGNNIEHILLHEHSGKNVWFVSLQKQVKVESSQNAFLEKISYWFFRLCDNSFIKRAIGYMYHIRDKIDYKSQRSRQALFGIWMLVSVFLLYSIIGWFFQIASNSQDLEWAKQDFIIAQDHIAKASENMNDADAFMLHIEAAEEIIWELEKEQLFLHDVEKLKGNVSILQKQFNGIESFETKAENTLFSFQESQKIVKVLSVSNKVYVVHDRSITGPILQWSDVENFVFEELSENDSFIDAAVYDSNIVLMTQMGKVVNFAKNNYYSYVDVSDQETWEKSPLIASYGANLYLLSENRKQILRHKKIANGYDAWTNYLKDEDAQNIWNILSIAIDGGIYILKDDGSVVKLFRSPEYRLEGIVLNNLPKNYDFSKESSHIPSIRARANLSYVYMLYDNKVLVFKPNTIRYQDVKSLNYLGQIEGKDIVIEDFYVDNDGEVFVASQGWVFKLEFDIWEEDIIVK